MKKYIAILAAFTMAVSLAACGSSATSSSAAAVSSTASSTASSVAESTVSSAVTTVSQTAHANGDTVYTGVEGVTGVTQNGTMNGFEIKADDGNVYYFATADNTVFNLSNGMSDGLNVAVYFGGANLGTDGGAVAIEVDEIADGESTAKGDLIITQAAMAATDANEKSSIMNGMGDVFTYVDSDVQTVEGTVSNGSMNGFTLTTADGTTYEIATCDATETAVSILDGIEVSVAYIGDLTGDYAVIAVS